MINSTYCKEHDSVGCNQYGKHTPTPWHLNDPIKTEIVSGYGSTDISVAQGLGAEDAAFIVRAVNAHSTLLAAAKAAINHLRACENNKIGHPFKSASLPLLEQAVATAEGK